MAGHQGRNPGVLRPLFSGRHRRGILGHEISPNRSILRHDKAGALELLAFLDELDIPYALATSSDLGAVRRHFEHFSLTGRFRHLVTQEDCEFGKPHPQPYLRAAEALGVSPADCLALEDSHNGIRSATSAGMMAIMVPDLLEPTDEILALCLGAVDDLHHVRRLLTGIPVM